MTPVEKGGYFGELALITHKGRAASAYAASADVKCACEFLVNINFQGIRFNQIVLFLCLLLTVLDTAAFERLLGPCVDIMERKYDNN